MLGSSRSEALFPEGPAQVIPYDGNEMPPTKPTSLQQAASAVFGVTTVVPLLIFVWTLHRIGALAHVESQLGLGLALGIALLGYYIFRRLMGRMSSLIQGLGRVVQQGMRPAGDAKASLAAAGKASGLITEYKPPAREQSAEPAPATPMAHAAIAGAATSESRPTAPAAAPILEPVPPPVHRSTPIPGLGMIQEMDDLSHAMAKLWMAEALGYKGRRVALTIMNARAPLTGTLIDVTHDELVLDQGGAQVTVNYGRLSGIDAA
jgi:hypothetical protein